MATISIDVDLSGEGFEEDEYGNFVPATPIMEQVISRVADTLLTKSFRDDFADAVRVEIKSRISGIVDELIEQPIQECDWAGNPKGEPRSVRQMLTDALEDWALRKPYEGDRYSQRAYSLGAKVSEWVQAETKASLSSYLERAKADVAKEVQKAALEATAELFAKAVQK